MQQMCCGGQRSRLRQHLCCSWRWACSSPVASHSSGVNELPYSFDPEGIPHDHQEDAHMHWSQRTGNHSVQVGFVIRMLLPHTLFSAAHRPIAYPQSCLAAPYFGLAMIIMSPNMCLGTRMMASATMCGGLYAGALPGAVLVRVPCAIRQPSYANLHRA